MLNFASFSTSARQSHPLYWISPLYEQLKMLKKDVKKILQRAPEEDICANEENEIFADLENLYADLEDLLKN